MVDRQARDASISDSDLMALTAAGDRGAFEQLIHRHAPAVLRLGRAVTGDAAAAEDALQQTFLAVYQHASTFRGDSSARAWMLTIARNAAYRMRAKASREDLAEEPWIQLGVEAGWGSEDPEALAMAAEQRDTLRTAMSTLSAQDREVLFLRDIEGLAAPEAAALMGIGQRALKSRLHRARLRLAAALRRAAQTSATLEQGELP